LGISQFNAVAVRRDSELMVKLKLKVLSWSVAEVRSRMKLVSSLLISYC
jgi:hypothetical protein